MQPYLQCLDCGQKEPESHINKGKHVCGKITSIDMLLERDMTLKIGKHRFIKIVIKK